MAPIPLEQAYPALSFRLRTRNWWARLFGQPAECVHLETEQHWMALLVPDKLYLRGKGSEVRTPARPEVSLCCACLVSVMEPELAAYRGSVVAFEPDPQSVSQYFFVDAADFEAAGLRPEVAKAVEQQLRPGHESCPRCSRRATWLWFSRDEVGSLDEVERIASAQGQLLCPVHGAAAFCRSLEKMADANLFYINLPYGDAGAYLWI